MATKARQQYFADEDSLQKKSREFSIADEIQQKIDSVEEGAQVNVIETVKVNGTALTPDANKAVNVEVPEVIDNLYTVDSDNALSAKQGKLLYDYIQNIASRGRFLSNWNSATGLPTTNPSESPYPYKSGDYFVVSNVAGLGGTNYRPDGSSYIIGQASTVVETEDVSVSDFYFYDGTNWLLLSNSGRQIAIDTSLSTTSTNPVENRVVTNAINGKQNTLTAGNHISISSDVISATGFQEPLTAGENITIGDECTTESDMKGPCPSGFHIPTNTEWTGVYNIWVTLGGGASDGTSFRQYFKMPGTGMRMKDSSLSLGSSFFWASNASGSTYAYCFRAGNGMLRVDTYSISYGLAIRPFKNTPVTPDNTWTTLYDGSSVAAGAGIFHNISEGLISISGDGSTWVTMADKDLGATTVWNNGDVLSDANRGYYYQRGNCYGFAKTGNITKISTTSVDGTGYGPGNYYESDTWINNSWTFEYGTFANLRGGVTQGTFQDCIHNVISAVDTTYTAGTGINIDANNVISSTVSPGTTYTAGSGIDITNNVISADTTVVATKTDIANFFDKVIDNSDDIAEGSTNLFLTSAERTILGNTSGTNTGDQTATDFDIKDLTDSTSLRSTWSGKQDALTAGTNIQINGSTISATDTTYNAGTGIAILNGVDYSALQGPCSTGFHVPTLGEVNKTKTIMNSLGLDTFNGWVNNFFISMAGFRYPRYGASQTMIGDGENRWTSTCQSGGRPYSVKVLGQSALTIQIDYSSNASFGACVRPFYNGYVEPTATWTVLNGTLGGPGIFHNAADGIISLNDGTNYITMADKNLGATTVYSSGDTRSQANCGNTYQWGNNYGFSYSSTVSTSNTKVDASTYGPGNYYSSSTFIQTTTSENDWSNPSNTNLWGGDVGIVTINNAITNIGVTSVNGQTGDVTIQTGGNYTAGTGINISNQNVISADTTVVATQTDLASKQGALTASTGINIDSSNNISNTLPGPTIAATAPTGTEGALWYDTTNDVLMAHDGTAWKEAGTQMKVLSYGHSTWQDFIDAYNENAIVYCKASSQSNPGTGAQGRMAFMAFVDINSSTQAIQGVEFQYYRSRSSHSTAATVLDEVYIYKLTPSSGGTWTVTQRDTAAEPIAGTGIGLTYNASGMTISADTSVLATQTDLNSKQDTLVSGTNIKTVNNESLLGTGNITISPGETPNVKVFTISGQGDTTTGQQIYDYYKAGNMPFVKYNNVVYRLSRFDASGVNFQLDFLSGFDLPDVISNSYSESSSDLIAISGANDVVDFTYSMGGDTITYLAADVNYLTPYTPQYNGSPATKKYVDDSIISTQANNILQSGMKIRAGTESDYGNLGTYDSNTLYLTIE